MRELTIPPELFERDPAAEEADEAVEFVRFWLADGAEHVSLQVGSMGSREVEQWGMMLADLTIHIVRALRLHGEADAEEALRARMERAYLGRLKDADPDHSSGSLLGHKH
jgi:uncharacterized protein DUF5076